MDAQAELMKATLDKVDEVMLKPKQPIETLDVLPGEGEVQVIRRVRTREECELCGEPAHYKHTFLLDGNVGARRNPASSAFGRDDCSWCEDAHTFVCRDCKDEGRVPPQGGYGWCSTYPASKRFAHVFLYWREEKASE